MTSRSELYQRARDAGLPRTIARNITTERNLEKWINSLPRAQDKAYNLNNQPYYLHHLKYHYKIELTFKHGDKLYNRHMTVANETALTYSQIQDRVHEHLSRHRANYEIDPTDAIEYYTVTGAEHNVVP